MQACTSGSNSAAADAAAAEAAARTPHLYCQGCPHDSSTNPRRPPVRAGQMGKGALGSPPNPGGLLWGSCCCDVCLDGGRLSQVCRAGTCGSASGYCRPGGLLAQVEAPRRTETRAHITSATARVAAHRASPQPAAVKTSKRLLSGQKQPSPGLIYWIYEAKGVSACSSVCYAELGQA